MGQVMSRDAQDEIIDYLYDELPPPRRAAFEARLRSDEALAREVASLRGVREAVARSVEAPPAPSAALLQNLQREARLQAPAMVGDSWLDRFFAGLLRPATGVAFAALAMVGTGLYLSRAKKDAAAPTAAPGIAILSDADKDAGRAEPSMHETTIETGDRAPAAAVPLPSPAAPEPEPVADEISAPSASALPTALGGEQDLDGRAGSGDPLGYGRGEAEVREAPAVEPTSGKEAERQVVTSALLGADPAAGGAGAGVWGGAVAQREAAQPREAPDELRNNAKGDAAPDEGKKKLEVYPVALGESRRNDEAAAGAGPRAANTLSRSEPELADSQDGAPAGDAEPTVAGLIQPADAPEREESARETVIVADRPSKDANAPPAVVQAPAPPASKSQASFGRRQEYRDAAEEAPPAPPAAAASAPPVPADEGMERPTLAAQRADKAVDALEKVMAESAAEAAPQTADGKRQRAQSLSGQGQLEQASAEYAALLAQYPNYAYRGAVLIDWAAVEVRLGRLESARNLLRRALAEPSMATAAKARLAEVEAQIAARAKSEEDRKAATGSRDLVPAAAPAEKTAETKPAESGSAAPAKPASPKQKAAAPKRAKAPSEADDMQEAVPEPAKK